MSTSVNRIFQKKQTHHQNKILRTQIVMKHSVFIGSAEVRETPSDRPLNEQKLYF